MKVRMTFWLAVAGEGGQHAAVVNVDVTPEEYEATIKSAGEAMRLQATYEMRGNDGVQMINMRYVTNYSIVRTTTVVNE